MSKSSCAAADSIADAFLRMAGGTWGTDVRTATVGAPLL